jgi:TPP-dependent 2-oxoacid decarboxylase
MRKSVTLHVLPRRRDVGIKAIFGFAREFAFRIGYTACSNPNFRWVGVASGIVMAFEFGTNGSVLSKMSGPIHGPLLS